MDVVLGQTYRSEPVAIGVSGLTFTRDAAATASKIAGANATWDPSYTEIGTSGIYLFTFVTAALGFHTWAGVSSVGGATGVSFNVVTAAKDDPASVIQPDIAAVQSDVDGLTTALATVDGIVDTIAASQITMQGNVTTLVSGVASANTKLDTNATAVTAIKATTDSLDLGPITTTLDDLTAAVASLEATLETDPDLPALIAAVADVQSAVDSVNTAIGTAQTSIDALSTELADVAALTSTVNDIETKTDTIITNVATVDTEVDGIASAQTTIGTNVGTLLTGQASAATAVGAIATAQTTMQGDVTAIKTPVVARLDTTISSRAALSGQVTDSDLDAVLASLTEYIALLPLASDWTPALAAKLDSVDPEAPGWDTSIWTEARAQKLDLIGAGTAFTDAPVSLDGGRITIRNAVAYNSALDNALVWVYTGATSLAGATSVTLAIHSRTVRITDVCTVTGSVPAQTITAELLSTQTDDLLQSQITSYDVYAVISGNEVNLFSGKVTVLPDVTP